MGLKMELEGGIGVCFPGPNPTRLSSIVSRGHPAAKTDGWLKKEMVTENAHRRRVFLRPLTQNACGANFAFSFWGSEFNFNFGRPIRGIRAVEGAIGDLRPLIVLPVTQCLGHA